ncbi:MAG: hypothetical protein PW844_01340 [Pantoea sp.]|uniref:hypothetical protein n=1 Tax=Pantoea sp. TaxID=69393 RepID=UPI0023957364|nr:hypothetical protein [Pantoea sp.]MDE1185117.1 hypothetical protein [Pantoea sp.]
MEALVKLVKQHDVLSRMLEIYVNQLLHGMMADDIRRIQALLMRRGANIATGTLTSQALSYAVVRAVSGSFGARVELNSKLAKLSAAAVTIVNYYGYVQEAADAANRLKQRNSTYYYALYSEKLEMLYFIVEPIIIKNAHLLSSPSSDDDIADAIMRIIR